MHVLFQNDSPGNNLFYVTSFEDGVAVSIDCYIKRPDATRMLNDLINEDLVALGFRSAKERYNDFLNWTKEQKKLEESYTEIRAVNQWGIYEWQSFEEEATDEFI